MLTVSFSEGLGNQMFQYSLYRALLEVREDVRAELSFFEDYEPSAEKPPRSYALGCFPNIKPLFASREELAALEDTGRDLLSRLRRRLFGQRAHIRAESYPTRFEPEVFRENNVILRGFWQNPRYFEGIEDVLRDDFSFAPLADEANLALLSEIESANSAALHIRRGDYLLHEDIFGGICTREYYERAAEIVASRNGGELRWYVFTDDPQWARERIKAESLRVVDLNSGESSWKDMYLMSRCKSVVCANSSFSWWAAWLCQRQGKTVVAPAYGPRRRLIPSEERVSDWNYLE